MAWTASVRVERIGYVNSVGRESAATPADAVRRQLIVPEHLTASYEWITQTQHQLETGKARVRHTADENAPHGRAVHNPSPYRWWLAALAQL